MTDPSFDPDRVAESLGEIQGWLDDRWDEQPFTVDETVKLLQELIDLTGALELVTVEVLGRAATKVELGQAADVLWLLSGLAKHLAPLEDD